MKRAVFICLAVLCLGSTSLPAAGPVLDFSLINKTGLTIMEVYVSPSKDDEWGEDVMGRDVLNNSETVDISFSRSETTCSWDLKVVDEDKDDIIWEKINLCEASEITLKYENKRPTAIIK
ncbi:MAG TPA: hypothetical protein VNJ02_17820 [Vicinamibacterales bacterium]|nr:hypothetical protein [Vicinamibacterales bacterium]